MLASLCSLIANAYSDKRRFSPADFMPRWDSEDGGQSPEDMLQTMSMALAKVRH